MINQVLSSEETVSKSTMEIEESSDNCGKTKDNLDENVDEDSGGNELQVGENNEISDPS